MVNSHYVGAYWGPRKEDQTECANRLLRLVNALAQVSDYWKQWFNKAATKQSALNERVFPELKSLESLFIRGRHFKDTPHEPIPELGYHVGIWNGKDGDAASTLTVTCGGWSGWVNNSVVLNLPASMLSATGDRLAAELGNVVGTFIDIFDPDSLRFSSDSLAVKLGLYDIDPPLKISPGWITYIAPRLNITLPGKQFLAVNPSLPAPESCVIAGQPPFSTDSTEQFAAVQRVLGALRDGSA